MIGPSLKREIENVFDVVAHKSNSDELVFLCPECGDKSGHRSVNLRTGLTFCFRCNKGQNNKGNFLAWAHALGYRFSASNDFSGVSVADLLASPERRSVIPPISKIKLPAGFTPIEQEPGSVYTKLISRMAVRKNLDYDAFVEAGAGFTRVNPKWEPFAIFPVSEYNVDVYYQGRTYEDIPGESTKLFPSRSEVKYGAAYWVYNIDELIKSRASHVIVLESVLNVLSMRRKFREKGVTDVVPVCVFKHHIGHVQLLKLLRCPDLKEICLLFDHDAIDNAWKLVEVMANKRVRMTTAEMPLLHGNKKLDANDDPEAALAAFESRKRFDFSTAIWKERDRILGTQKRSINLNGMRIDKKVSS